jgi:hypothetical protein
MLRTLSIAAAALALCACATEATTTAAGEGRDCFRAIDVDRYGIVDDDHIRVTVSPTRHYILTISPSTRDFEFSNSMALVSPTNFICTGNGWDLELHAGNPPRSHRVVTVERAPPDADEQPAPTGS